MLFAESRLNPIMSSSRIYRGLPKPDVDYLARNRQVTSKQSQKAMKANARKPSPHQPVKATAPLNSMYNDAPANSVTVSKSYLDNLLRLTAAPPHQNNVNHVQMDCMQVPGLDPSHALTATQPHTVTAPQNNAPSTTANERWMNDIAKQVDEKKSKRQRTKPPQTEEVYFPFGRPGCGAPLRTLTGEVVADLRSRVRASFEGPIEQVATLEIVHQQRPNSPKVDRDYYPYGRPGCGAPNADTTSNAVSYQSYGAESYSQPQQVNTQQQIPHQQAIQQQIPHQQLIQQQLNQQSVNFQQLNQQQLNYPPTANYQPQQPGYTSGPPLSQSIAPATLSSYQSKGQNNQPTVTEDYYPYGRPGCGAPLTQAQAMPSHAPQPAQQDVSPPREGFARGAGPYVDKFVQHELNQRRRIELDYRAQLAEQIAAKENEKHKVRLAKQMADAEESGRLQQERYRLNEQYQREAAEKRRKEEMAAERQRVLKRGIEEAQSDALALVTKKKAHSQKRDSVRRSPSMLETAPSTEIPQQTSRIPIRRSKKSTKGGQRAPSGNTVARQAPPPQYRRPAPPSQYRRPAPPPSPPIPTLAKRRNQQPPTVRSNSPPIPTLAKRRNQQPPTVRSNSPPIPTLAKKLLQNNSTAFPRSLDINRDLENKAEAIVRSRSPPIPTLAKKQSRDQSLPQLRPQSPPVPTLVRKLTQGPSSVELPSIYRQPSCELIRGTTSLLGDHYGNETKTGGPTRQEVILEQLAALKKGILTHESALNQRINQIITKQKPTF